MTKFSNIWIQEIEKLRRDLAEIDEYISHYKDYPLIRNLIAIREAQKRDSGKVEDESARQV